MLQIPLMLYIVFGILILDNSTFLKAVNAGLKNTLNDVEVPLTLSAESMMKSLRH